MERTSQSIQDHFLNMVRRDRVGVTIWLMSGIKLTGRIRGFDKFCLILESGQQQQLIFKHAISTVALPRGEVYRFEGDVESVAEISGSLENKEVPVTAREESQTR